MVCSSVTHGVHAGALLRTAWFGEFVYPRNCVNLLAEDGLLVDEGPPRMR